jgi:hypothetical protein
MNVHGGTDSPWSVYTPYAVPRMNGELIGSLNPTCSFGNEGLDMMLYLQHVKHALKSAHGHHPLPTQFRS